MRTDLARHNELSGVALAATSAIAFGTLAIFGKYAYDEGADPVALLAGRFVLSALLLAGYHVATGRSLVLPRRATVRLLLMGALGYAFESALFFLALERSPAGTVALIFYSYPMWVALMSLVWGLERFQPRLAVALLLGTAGVSMIFSLTLESPAGPLLALGAAIAVAIYFIFAQVVMRGIDARSSAFWTATGAAITTAAAAAVTRSELPSAALPHAFGLAAATSIAFVLLYAAIARIGSARAAVAAMLEPVTTVILAALLLSEEITLRSAIGAALIVSALPVLATTRRREEVAAEP
ncbi:MAG: DMT family transporter [Actinomycetota bacterium]